MNPHLSAGLLLAALAAGCSTVRQTDPPITATEQLLISSAIDRAAAQMQLGLPKGSKVYLDTQHLDIDANVIYPRYTIAAVSEELLRQGVVLVPSRDVADIVVQLRSGAQSINNESSLIGMPSFTVPVPLAGNFTVPEIPLYKYYQLIGISKLAAVAYRRDGGIVASTGLQYGEAKQSSWVVLLVFSYKKNELLPEHHGGSSASSTGGRYEPTAN